MEELDYYLIGIALVLLSPVIWAFISARIERNKAGFKKHGKRHKTQG
jgi:hypothetical protein